MSGTGLGRAAFHYFPVLKVVIGGIPFFNKVEMVVKGSTKKYLMGKKNNYFSRRRKEECFDDFIIPQLEKGSTG